MDELMLKNVHRSMSGQQVSRTFKRIARTLCSRFWHDEFDQPYSPSLVDIQYLVDRIIKRHKHDFLRLKHILLTTESGSYLGYLLNNTRIKKILIGNIGDGELALIKHVKMSMEYKFCNRIRFDRIESLANALNKSSSSLDFSDSNITVDDFRVIFRVLIENMKESKQFDYDLKWNQSFDINQLELDKLLDCAERPQLTVHNSNDYGTQMKVSNYSEVNVFLKIYVGHNKIKIGEMKQFLNKNKNKDFQVEVDEHETECLLLTSMIDIFKQLPMSFEINYSTEQFFGQEKLKEIMEGIVETHLSDFKIFISELTSEDFELIIDKIKNMKLQTLSLCTRKMINLSFQTVDELSILSETPSLCIDRCELNYELTKKLVCQLERNKLQRLSITHTNLSNTMDCIISMLLNGSNLTSVELTHCQINCEHVRMIAESLKNTKITSIDLTGNKIKDIGVKAIANVVGQTKLHKLYLDENLFTEDGAIELLKSIQKTKITVCHMNSICYTNGVYGAIANILKDNKILLHFIERGKNDKIDEYSERNYNSFHKARLVIDKYQKGTLSYHYKYKKYFEAFELFSDTDVLWYFIQNEQKTKLKLKNKIKDNYMKICGVIKDKLEVNNKNSGNERNFADLSPEIINIISSNLSLSDVIS